MWRSRIEATLSRALPEVLLLGAVAVCFRRGLGWIGTTLVDQDYASWGALSLLLLVPLLLRLPARRVRPSGVHLAGVAALCGADLLLSPLRLNVLSAALGVVALHLSLVAMRRFSGSWVLKPHLALGLLCLPVVHWANVLFGFHLQHLVSRLAAAGLGLYGLPVRCEGTVLHLPGAVVAVDTSCSGLKMLFSGILLGLLLTPSVPGVRRKVALWAGHLGLLLLANVVRVMSLATAQLTLGEPVGQAAHQAMGLCAFVLAAAGTLGLTRLLSGAGRAAHPDQDGRSHSTMHLADPSSFDPAGACGPCPAGRPLARMS